MPPGKPDPVYPGGRRTGILNEIISHGIDGLKSYAGNPNSLADSIIEALYNKDLCKQIAKNAKEKVTKEFNWDIISKNTMNVYKESIKLAKVTSKEKVKLENKRMLIESPNKATTLSSNLIR